jgi:predicted dehydrogenase
MSEIPTIGVGMLGYAFMGKAHSHAYRTLPHIVFPPPLVPRLVALGGRNPNALREAAERYGFDRGATDWREIVEDPDVELFDNVGPNGMHAEPTIAAAEAGKHVLCEKPLGRDADEAYEIWSRVAATDVKHMCAFNYRFVPAIRLARELVAAGELGELYHFRARYLQEWVADPGFPMTWRLRKEEAGSGALGDLGAHVVDLGRYLVGEPARVTGLVTTFIAERSGGTVDVDDAFAATVEFDSGAVGTLEASRFCSGRKNALAIELNGSKGSLVFDLERINELRLHTGGANPRTEGFRTILVTESDHPFLDSWWPPGHVLGWEHTFVHELHHFLRAVANDEDVGPHGATFEDGYRAAEACDAIVRAARDGGRETIRYRDLATPASVPGTPTTEPIPGATDGDPR